MAFSQEDQEWTTESRSLAVSQSLERIFGGGGGNEEENLSSGKIPELSFGPEWTSLRLQALGKSQRQITVLGSGRAVALDGLTSTQGATAARNWKMGGRQSVTPCEKGRFMGDP